MTLPKEKNYNEPSIYLHCFEFTAQIFTLTSNFPKPARYVLGQRLDEKSTDLLLEVSNIVHDWSLKKRIKCEGESNALSRASRKLRHVRVLLAMARRCGHISAGKNDDLVKQVIEIGKEIGGIMKFFQNNQGRI